MNTMPMSQPHYQEPRVLKAVFGQTGTYNDIFMRPYQTHLNDRSMINQFQEATQQGRNINPVGVSSAVGHFLKPSNEYIIDIKAPNGWDTPRLRFLIELEYVSPFDGNLTRTYLQGYTSHLGVNPATESIDRDMILYFNNVLVLNEQRYSTPYGPQSSFVPAQSYQLLNPTGCMTQSQTHTMRPMDLFMNMGVNSMMGGMEDVQDYRSTFAMSPIKNSKRSYGVPGRYVSEILNKYTQASTSAQLDISDVRSHHEVDSGSLDALGEQREYSMASNMCSLPDVMNNPFFLDLSSKISQFKDGGAVSYGELERTFPNITHQSKFQLNRQVMDITDKYGQHQRGQTEHWKGVDIETQWANTLAHSIPSLMMDLMLMQLGFTATNQTVDGTYDIRLATNVASFTQGFDYTNHVQAFLTRLEHEVLRTLTSNTGIDFYLTMWVDVINDTRIHLTIAGGYTREFVVPSFCDGLFSPVMTPQAEHLNGVSSDFNALMSSIGTQYQPSHYQQQTQYSTMQPGGAPYDTSKI